MTCSAHVGDNSDKRTFSVDDNALTCLSARARYTPYDAPLIDRPCHCHVDDVETATSHRYQRT